MGNFYKFGELSVLIVVGFDPMVFVLKNDLALDNKGNPLSSVSSL